jgi:hypothetical protein
MHLLGTSHPLPLVKSWSTDERASARADKRASDAPGIPERHVHVPPGLQEPTGYGPSVAFVAIASETR